MKKTILMLILLALAHNVSAQKEFETIVAKPVAFDRYYWLSSPQMPFQVFIVEVQNDKKDLLKIIYFPETDGLRGGKTEFVAPKTLNNKTLWNLKLRNPKEEEKTICKIDNFITSKSDKNSTTNKEPTLRFRSTQMDADIKFNNLSEMPCMILDSIPQIVN